MVLLLTALLLCILAAGSRGQQVADPKPGQCNSDCVCIAEGGAPKWDLQALGGTRTADGAGGSYRLNLCGNIDPVPNECLAMNPSVVAAQAVRLANGFCNQVGPDYATADPADDLQLVAPFLGGARFQFAFTSQASGARRSLRVDVVCDHAAEISGPGEVKDVGGSGEPGDNVQLEWRTVAVCRLSWGLPFLMVTLIAAMLYAGLGIWWGRRTRRERRESVADALSGKRVAQIALAHPHASMWASMAGLVLDGVTFSWQNVTHRAAGIYAVITSGPPPPPLENSAVHNPPPALLAAAPLPSGKPSRPKGMRAKGRRENRVTSSRSRERSEPLLRPEHALLEAKGEGVHSSMAPIRVESIWRESDGSQQKGRKERKKERRKERKTSKGKAKESSRNVKDGRVDL